MENKEIAYLILQSKYLKMLGYDNSSEEEILKNSLKLFPSDWFNYDIDKKIELIAKAINNNVNLNSIVEDLEDGMIK